MARSRVPSRGLLGRVRRTALYARRYLEYNPFIREPYENHNPFRVALTYLRNRSRFRAVAWPYRVISVNPQTIRWNLGGPSRKWLLGSILDGDWDIDYRRPVDVAWKITSMRQRFVVGLDWEETDLFQRFYLPQFRLQRRVRGASSIDDLAAHYRRVYDPLFERIRDQGFKTPTMEFPDISFMYVHIGRDGDIMFTIGGNHRLGIAIALELRSVPVRVLTRHLAWQRVRDEIKRGLRTREEGLDHPDLEDLDDGRSWPKTRSTRATGASES